ncbi:MAG TPA: hypothetical protein VGJ17_03175 [Candidatus Limnocylindrales bacterium]|jgi:hypothetical protein
MRSRSLTHAAYAAMTLLLLTLLTAGGAQAATIHGGKTTATATARGYDISFPQCGSAYPTKPAFGIVGVNKGIVFSVNPCLASQITWAGGTRAQLYANTGNPGPALSSHWPAGQQAPRVCDAANPDTAACAYDYGWNAAKDSYADAAAAWAALHLTGSPAASAWWLDVETSNSWRTATALNVAALQGEVAGLQAKGVARIGIYSTGYQWGVITGSSKAFAANPSWIAGASSLKNAQSRCSNAAFTGGTIALVQYPYRGFDGDVAC